MSSLKSETDALLRGVPSEDRRRFMQRVAAALALAGAGACSRAPLEKIIPYVEAPELERDGQPLFYATALTRNGYASGVLAESRYGRPVKVEGNPAHPASLGATDIFAQAAVLDLWDPQRSQAVLQQGQPSAWPAFLTDLQSVIARHRSARGARFHVLSETVLSPTLADQAQAFADAYPEAVWHQFQPVNRDNVYGGARLAFGAEAEPVFHFDRAAVVCSLDADFLQAMPGHLRYARDFIGRHSPDSPHGMSRVYAAECTPSLTGAMADHRVGLRSRDIHRLALALAERLGVPGISSNDTSGLPQGFLAALADELKSHAGASLVLAGDWQDPAVHSLCHAINHALGNAGATVDYLPPLAWRPQRHGGDLQSLAQAMAAGEVDALVILGGNPAYTAGGDSGFADALGRVPFSVHLSAYVDETSKRCRWHVPAAHAFEAWSDARSFDGTVSIQQPLIAPLYEGRSPHELMAVMLGGAARSGYDLVRQAWMRRTGGRAQASWEDTLRTGVEPGSSPAPLSLRPSAGLRHDIPTGAAERSDVLEVVFRPDPTLEDGRHAHNGWLQELPKPLTQLTWDNAILMSEATARRLDVRSEDWISVRRDSAQVSGPVWVMPGQPDGVLTMHLGHGRQLGGDAVPAGGFNAYPLQRAASPWRERGVIVQKAGRRYALASTQGHQRMEGRDIVRVANLERYRRQPAFARHEESDSAKPGVSLYPSYPYAGYKWGMSIDLGACIGCKACTIACQAENNIPVVGKEEVLRGREMHWIRVDRYYDGGNEQPHTYFQPVPCMHCETAPCEVVCPVGATVHDDEGLNLQVYNRCVGTRFCSNNCPYKVRRFNFLQYSQDAPSLAAGKNPDVSVRMRGVMEKCTYCVQRIVKARIAADRDGRRIADGEVVTACQAVCPTQAIVFGDLNDPQSRVSEWKRSSLNYSLLGELNTRPRTTYLTEIRNPNSELKES